MVRLSREEQETTLLYCPAVGKWHISTDVPNHIRRYNDLIISPVQQWENGELIYTEGYLDGTVSIRKRTVMTDEQKQAATERLRKARLQKGQS